MTLPLFVFRQALRIPTYRSTKNLCRLVMFIVKMPMESVNSLFDLSVDRGIYKIYYISYKLGSVKNCDYL